MKFQITSNFHAKENFREHLHNGIDYNFPLGTELKSVADGVVRVADYGNTNAGKTVFVDTPDGQTVIYGHLNDFTVQNGQTVHVGDVLGHSGNTGFSTGPHLHFGLKINGEYVDPSPYNDMVANMDSIQQASCLKFSTLASLPSSDVFNSAMSQFNDMLSNMVVHFIHFSSYILDTIMLFF